MANTTITPAAGSLVLAGYSPTRSRAYPTLPTTINSRPRKLDGRMQIRASNGALKVRKLFPSDKAEFVLEHELTAAQKATLDSHYQSDGLNSFAYTWPGFAGGVYLAGYLAAPQYIEMPGGWYKATVTLGEV